MEKYLIWLLAAVAVFLIFGLLVFVHELGHFLAARLLGLRADVFSIGFGKAIWKKKVGDTEYRIAWIPFGGYVVLPQLDPEGMDKIQGNHDEGCGDDESSDDENGDAEQTVERIPPAAWWKRIIVSVSGPLGNVLFACVLSLAVAALPPVEDKRISFGGAVVGGIDTNSPAIDAGLRLGDKITSINGRKVQSWVDFMTEAHLSASGAAIAAEVTNILDGATAKLDLPVEANDMGHFSVPGLSDAHLPLIGGFTNSIVAGATPAEAAGLTINDVIFAVNGVRIVGVDHFIKLVRYSSGEPLRIAYMRDDEFAETEVLPEPRADGDDGYQIGVILGKTIVSVPMWLQHRNPADQIKGDAASIGRVLEGLKSRKGAARVGKGIGGPVMILSMIWVTMFTSLAGVLAFARFLNINLAILNLLPLPVLDGGQVVFALWRGIFGKEISPKVLNVLVNTFAILLIGMFLYLTTRDVLSLGKIFSK